MCGINFKETLRADGPTWFYFCMAVAIEIVASASYIPHREILPTFLTTLLHFIIFGEILYIITEWFLFCYMTLTLTVTHRARFVYTYLASAASGDVCIVCGHIISLFHSHPHAR